MKKHIVATLLAVTALTATFAHAQTQVSGANGVTVTRPAGWEDAQGNERGTFTFREPNSNSQIEVISTSLLTADVKDVFFNTFHDALKAANFVQSKTGEKTYGNNAGVETIYAFDHSGAELTVAVFEFVSGNTAWLVVSYVGAESFDQMRGAYEEVASTLSLAP